MKQHALKRFSNKENHPNFGKPLSEKTKENIRKALKGRSYNELHGKEKAKEIKTKIKEARSRQVTLVKNTLIEMKIQDFLTILKIEFLTHKYMNIKNSYQCDIFIPSRNLIIECDGDFFHCNPEKYSEEFIRFPKQGTKTAKEVWKVDNERTKQLIKKGYNVLRLWGSEIKQMTLKEFERKVNQVTC